MEVKNTFQMEIIVDHKLAIQTLFIGNAHHLMG